MIPTARVRPARYFWPALVLILLLGFGFRAWNLGAASLWTDEVSTEYRAQAPLADSLESIRDAGNQTPPYYLLLRPLPTATELQLRLPSALLGVLGIALLVCLVRNIYGQPELALWVGLLLAANPYHVWLSRTARAYTLVMVLAVIMSYFFLKLLQGHRSRAVWAGFTLSSMAAYFTQLTAVAMPGAQFVLFALYMRQERRFFRRWLAAQVIAALPTLAWLAQLLLEPPQVKSEWVPRPELKDLPLTLWNMTAGYEGEFHWFLLPGLFIAVTGLAWGVITVVREGRAHRENLYWLWLVVVPWLPVFVISQVISFYVDRYFVVFLPALIVLTVAGWRTLPGINGALWRGALVALVIFNTASILAVFDSGEYRRADWERAANYITQRYQPGDGILLERANVERTFRRYFDPDQVSGDPDILQLYDTKTYDTPVDTTAFEQRHTRIWAIYRNPNEDVHHLGIMLDFDPFAPGPSLMGDWLHVRQDRVRDQYAVNGVTVILLAAPGD